MESSDDVREGLPPLPKGDDVPTRHDSIVMDSMLVKLNELLRSSGWKDAELDAAQVRHYRQRAYEAAEIIGWALLSVTQLTPLIAFHPNREPGQADLSLLQQLKVLEELIDKFPNALKRSSETYNDVCSGEEVETLASIQVRKLAVRDRLCRHSWWNVIGEFFDQREFRAIKALFTDELSSLSQAILKAWREYRDIREGIDITRNRLSELFEQCSHENVQIEVAQKRTFIVMKSLLDVLAEHYPPPPVSERSLWKALETHH